MVYVIYCTAVIHRWVDRLVGVTCCTTFCCTAVSGWVDRFVAVVVCPVVCPQLHGIFFPFFFFLSLYRPRAGIAQRITSIGIIQIYC